MDKKSLELIVIMGLKFRLLREQSNLTQEEVSVAIGLSRVSVINIEQGRQGLKADNILKASKLFKCNITELFPDDSELIISLNDYSGAKNVKKEKTISRLEKRIKELSTQLKQVKNG